jgi:hypothetical protein
VAVSRWKSNDRRLRLAFWLLAASAALAAPASAQVDEADRLARCANNRERLARIETESAALERRIGSFWSDEKLARARSFARSLAPDASRPAFDLQELMDQWAHSAGEFGIPRCRMKFDPNAARSPLQDCRLLYSREIASRIDRETERMPERDSLLRERLRLRGEVDRHRTNLAALDCDRTAAADGRNADSGGNATSWMTGSFATSEGDIILSPTGGSYDQDSGRLSVTRIAGNVMEGRWREGSSGRRCADGSYYGRFRFTFTAAGFSGAWGYCDDEPDHPWTGTRKG